MEDTTAAMCTLCSKKLCTAAHTLGACKVSLQQGRYRFRNDTVLHKVIQSFKTFISKKKETVHISAESSTKFVKKGAKVPRNRTPSAGILHHAFYVILLADLIVSQSTLPSLK